MKPDLITIYKQLSQKDIRLLHHLYLFRCLTIRQSLHTIYDDDYLGLEDFLTQKVENLKSLGVIEVVSFGISNQALFLTTKGVDILREVIQLPTEIFNPDTKTYQRGYYRAGELRMNPRLVNHQIHLNQFVLELIQYAESQNIAWKYYDEKHVSQYFTIRPDGLFQMLDIDFFIEMDMSTESHKQLIEKWNHYRDFFRSKEYESNERKIIVLFVTDNTKNVQNRKNVVLNSAFTTAIDLFNDRFDMYIDSRPALLKLLAEHLVPQIMQTEKQSVINQFSAKYQFIVRDAETLKNYLHNSIYSHYARKVSGHNIAYENNRLQEFLIDDYRLKPLSVLKKMVYHKRNANHFYLKMKRTIPYIIVVESEESIYSDIRICDIETDSLVFFTTAARIEQYPFEKAIFQLDRQGNIYSFVNNGLHQRVFERSLNN